MRLWHREKGFRYAKNWEVLGNGQTRLARERASHTLLAEAGFWH